MDDTQVSLYVGVFSVLIALFGMVIIVAKSFSLKPILDTFNHAIKELRVTVKDMADYLKECRYEDKRHQDQSERTHNEIHEIHLIVTDINNGMDKLIEKIERLEAKI